jgi:hypothetical protein
LCMYNGILGCGLVFLVIKIGRITNVNAMKDGGGDGALGQLEKLDIRFKTR